MTDLVLYDELPQRTLKTHHRGSNVEVANGDSEVVDGPRVCPVPSVTSSTRSTHPFPDWVLMCDLLSLVFVSLDPNPGPSALSTTRLPSGMTESRTPVSDRYSTPEVGRIGSGPVCSPLHTPDSESRPPPERPTPLLPLPPFVPLKGCLHGPFRYCRG